MKPTQGIFYLGVDGGATKSTAILVSENDTIIAQRLGKSLSHQSETKEGVKKNLETLVSPLLKKAARGKLYAVFGLAGLDTKKDEIFYTRLVRSLLPKNSVFQVVNDANIAIEAKCPNEENRILVISGTGSSVYGESGKKQAKSVGWDFILGDEGSGYDIGLKIMKIAIHSWDGRIKKTMLEDIVLAHTQSKTMEAFIEKVYDVFHNRKENLKQYIASFGILLNKAIEENDWAALQIQQEVVQDLTQEVEAVAAKLDLQGKDFCLGMTGSVWKMPGLRQKFQEKVKTKFPQVRFSDTQEESPWGAISLAKRLAH